MKRPPFDLDQWRAGTVGPVKGRGGKRPFNMTEQFRKWAETVDVDRAVPLCEADDCTCRPCQLAWQRFRLSPEGRFYPAVKFKTFFSVPKSATKK